MIYGLILEKAGTFRSQATKCEEAECLLEAKNISCTVFPAHVTLFLGQFGDAREEVTIMQEWTLQGVSLTCKREAH